MIYASDEELECFLSLCYAKSFKRKALLSEA